MDWTSLYLILVLLLTTYEAVKLTEKNSLQHRFPVPRSQYTEPPDNDEDLEGEDAMRGRDCVILIDYEYDGVENQESRPHDETMGSRSDQGALESEEPGEQQDEPTPDEADDDPEQEDSDHDELIDDNQDDSYSDSFSYVHYPRARARRFC